MLNAEPMAQSTHTPPSRFWHRRPGGLASVEREAILDELFFEGAELSPYLYRLGTLMGLSAIIAALGLIADSAAVVIGAMLVAPLMTPIMGFAGSLVMGWPGRQFKAALLVAAASAEAIALAWLVSAVVPAFRPILLSQELLTRTGPRLLDLAIALAAGAAGAYVTVRQRAAGALPGVAIAVALVPPLAAVGVLLELGRTHLAAGAALLYATNLVAIVLAAAIVFLLTGFTPKNILAQHKRRIRLGILTTLLALAAVAYPLQRESRTVLHKAQNEQAVSQAVTTWLENTNLEVTDASLDDKPGQLQVTIDVAGAQPPPPAQTLAKLIAQHTTRKINLTVRWAIRREEQAILPG